MSDRGERGGEVKRPHESGSEGRGRSKVRREPPTPAESAGVKALGQQQEAIRKLMESAGVKALGQQQEAIRNLMESAALGNAAQMQRALAQDALSTLLIPRAPIPSFASVPAPRQTPPEKLPEQAVLPQLERLVNHAPPGWEGSRDARGIAVAIRRKRAIRAFVLAADIRSSTLLMREAIDPYQFAATLENFTKQARDTIWKNQGLFDKFTGDGFLAYWPFTTGTKLTVLRRVFSAVRELHQTFVERHKPQFQINSQNYPQRAGLAVGLDCGEVTIVAMAVDPTIVGPAVVGAVRMVSGADSRETMANVQVADFVLEHESRFPTLQVIPTTVSTKEYEDQVASALVFADLVLEEA